MSDDLNNKLRDLHDQIDPSIAKDPETKVKMAYMKDRVGELTERGIDLTSEEDHQSLLDQLEEMVVQVQTDHPGLAGLIRGVINSLSNSGV